MKEKEAREVKLKRSIDKMSTAQMRYALYTFEESHEQNLEYITSLRQEINELKEELKEAQADNEDSDDSPAFQKHSLDIAGIEY